MLNFAIDENGKETFLKWDLLKVKRSKLSVNDVQKLFITFCGNKGKLSQKWDKNGITQWTSN